MAATNIYSPEGSVDPNAMPTARVAIGALAGKRIAALDNGKAGAAHLLRAMGQSLATRTGATFVGVFQKQTAATPCETDLLDRLAAEVEVVLTGTAD
ncbi:MAG: hypothetical protein NXI30_08540 [bacterium]|nr:hypothetical protein [bacterium]